MTQTLATIDMGTNSFLMLVCDVAPSGKTRIVCDRIHTPRLGESLHQTGFISELALERATQALEDFKKILTEFNVTHVYPFTTAAVREAKNQTEVLSRLSQAIGTQVELIAPHKEAELTFLSVVHESPSSYPTAVIDIGGGSTEIAIGSNTTYTSGHSYPIGTVKLFDAYFKTSITLENINAARVKVKEVFKTFDLKTIPTHVFGTAGSFTHIASIELQLSAYTSEAVNHFMITPELTQQWIERCLNTPPAQLATLKGADPRRIDLLLPGCIIIEQLQACFGISNILVKDRGMRFGKLFEVAPFIKAPLEFA